MDALRQETLQIRQDINAVRISTDAPQNRARSFADAVRQGRPPAPAHHLSAHGSDSSPGITRSELGEDREVIVHLGDTDAVKRYRGLTAKDVKRRAEKAKVDAAHRFGVPTLASVAFVAVRQLKSGDICFTMRSAKEAEIARTHQGWAKSLCKEAKVHLPTWGIVVHDVNVKTLRLNKAAELGNEQEQQRLIKELETSNQYTWGADAKVIKLHWAAIPEGKKAGSMIIELNSPVTANKAIDLNTLVGDDSLTTVLYDRAARIRQCHRCQQYGHIGTTCSNGAKCVFCAEEHLSRECKRQQDGMLSERKCANCGGAHSGWSKRCEAFRKEIERVEARRAVRPRYHRVPAHISMSQQSVGSRTEGSSAPQGTDPVSSGSGSSARSSSGEQTHGDSGLVRSVSSLQTSQQAEKGVDTPSVATSSNANRVSQSGFKTSTKGGRKGKNKKGVQEASEAMDTREDPAASQSRPLQQQEVSQVQAITDSIHRSIHTPTQTQSEPSRRPSKASKRISEIPRRMTRMTTRVSEAVKKACLGQQDKDGDAVFDEGLREKHDQLPIYIDDLASTNDQNTEYRPSSALTEKNSNTSKGSVARKASGKENLKPVFPNAAKSTKSAPAGRSRPMKRKHGADAPVGEGIISTGFSNRSSLKEARKKATKKPKSTKKPAPRSSLNE